MVYRYIHNVKSDADSMCVRERERESERDRLYKGSYGENCSSIIHHSLFICLHVCHSKPSSRERKKKKDSDSCENATLQRQMCLCVRERKRERERERETGIDLQKQTHMRECH